MRAQRVVITGTKLLFPGITRQGNPESFNFDQYFPDGLPRRLAGLDRGSKYLLATVKELLRGAEISNKQRAGAAVATLFGSNASRIRFLRGILQEGTRSADPIAFKTTVPSVAAGALAILCQCCGPTLTCVGSGEAGLAALHNACLLIQRGVADEMIVGGYEDLPEDLLKMVSRKFKGESPWTEGGAALLVKNEAVCVNNGEKILARIHGFGVSGHGVTLANKKKALYEAVKMACNAGDKTVDAVISAGIAYREVEQDMFPGCRVIDTTAVWGEALGMSGIIRLAAAVDALIAEKPNKQSPISNILVNGMGMSGTAYTVMLSKF